MEMTNYVESFVDWVGPKKKTEFTQLFINWMYIFVLPAQYRFQKDLILLLLFSEPLKQKWSPEITQLPPGIFKGVSIRSHTCHLCRSC